MLTSFKSLINSHQRLFKRLITEDIGADLNDGFDTFIEKKGKILVYLFPEPYRYIL